MFRGVPFAVRYRRGTRGDVKILLPVAERSKGSFLWNFSAWQRLGGW